LGIPLLLPFIPVFYLCFTLLWFKNRFIPVVLWVFVFFQLFSNWIEENNVLLQYKPILLNRNRLTGLIRANTSNFVSFELLLFWLFRRMLQLRFAALFEKHEGVALRFAFF
jgi:hypothetical protein